MSISHSVTTFIALPLGPKPLPLIGDLLDIPLKKEAATYNSWAKKYGLLPFRQRALFDSNTYFKVTWYVPMS